MEETRQKTAEEKYCTTCGSLIHIRAEICPKCGVRQPYSASYTAQFALNQKNRLVYILLAIFLGGFGVHNFYAGYNRKGLTQLLITVLVGWLIIPLIIVGIWIIVDIVTVTKDSNGIPFSQL